MSEGTSDAGFAGVATLSGAGYSSSSYAVASSPVKAASGVGVGVRLDSLLEELDDLFDREDISAYWDRAREEIQSLVDGINSSDDIEIRDRAAEHLDLFLRHGGRFLSDVQTAVPEDVLAGFGATPDKMRPAERHAREGAAGAHSMPSPLAESIVERCPIDGDEWQRIIDTPYG